MLLLAASSCLVASGALVAALVRLPTLTSFLLGVYLFAFAEVVALSLLLSPFDALTPKALFAGTSVVLGATFVAARLLPTHVPPVQPAITALRAALRDPLLMVLAALVAAAGVYVLALAVVTPPNDWDALTYHLSRAAFWKQQHAVGYIADVSDIRLNVNPPNAEIAMGFTMILSESDRYVALVQTAAVLVCSLAVYGLGRRLVLPLRAALFGALLFGTLPIVLLQAASALNDVVVAAFLLAAAYFLVGRARADVPIAALALGLAIGTKFTALFALPLLLLVGLVVHMPRSWPRVALTAVGGLLAGSVWYVLNLVETGQLEGGLRESAQQEVARSLTAAIDSFRLYATEWPDLSGAIGRDALLYTVSSIGFIAAAAVAALRNERGRMRAFAACALVVALVPLEVELVREAMFRGLVAEGRGNTAADTAFSWYGPLGLVLPFAAATLVWRLDRTRPNRGLGLVLALAPLFAVIVVASTLAWDPWRGRFFMFGFGLSAATWGFLLLRTRIAAWAVVAVAASSVVLCLAHFSTKPSGIRVVEPVTIASIWSIPRWQAQELLRRSDPPKEFLRAVETRVPASADIALAVREDDFVHPYFGPSLRRHVHPVVPWRPPDVRADWLVRAPRLPVVCREAWSRVWGTHWQLLRRIPGARCDAGSS
jgi:4-amino-4-deoxy-L-arabinose transferase-like glycosyltransferase